MGGGRALRCIHGRAHVDDDGFIVFVQGVGGDGDRDVGGGAAGRDRDWRTGDGVIIGVDCRAGSIDRERDIDVEPGGRRQLGRSRSMVSWSAVTVEVPVSCPALMVIGLPATV